MEMSIMVYVRDYQALGIESYSPKLGKRGADLWQPRSVSSEWATHTAPKPIASQTKSASR